MIPRLRHGLSRLTLFGRRLFNLITLSEQRELAVLSVAVGLSSGVSAFLFKRLLDAVHHFCCSSDLTARFLLFHWFWALLPAVGGLLAGLLIFRYAPEAKGHGVAEVVFSLKQRGGRIRPRVALVKTVASALTIGTGGSAGPEGPVIQIGAAIGSSVGQWLGLPPSYLRTLVAAGAAGGVAAVFNAPIAAVIFSMEVLLREFTAQAFSMVVLSSVIASVTSHLLLGEGIFLPTPPFGIEHPGELGLYFLLGALAAEMARGFVKSMTFMEEQFARWNRVTEPFKPMVGGFFVGMLGLSIPMILGAGYSETTSMILTGSAPVRFSLLFLLLLMIGKIVATSLTLGSGGSGGILMPLLFVGATMGNLFGQVANFLLPGISPPGAYSLVGMGLMFACVVQAPFTAIVLMFEITRDYQIVIPLMFSVTIAVLIYRQRGSVGLEEYALLKRGVRLEEMGHPDPLTKVTADEVMVREVESVSPHMTLEEFIGFILQSPHSGFPVVDGDGTLLGLITYAEAHRALSDGTASKETSIDQMMRRNIAVAYPQEYLAGVVKRMQEFQVDRIPVVGKENPRRMIGLLTKSNVLAAYQMALKRV